MTFVGTSPVAFTGTAEEKAANRATHYFRDGRCQDCDCRPFGRVAEYPCGVEPARELTGSYDQEFDARFRIYADMGGTA